MTSCWKTLNRYNGLLITRIHFETPMTFLKSNTETSSKIAAMFLMTFSHTFDSNGLSLLFLDGIKGLNNNQGIEGLNKQIKKSHTFKRRCPLANFMDIVSRMVQEWSKEEEVLSLSRKEMLFNPRDGLKLRTDGYQWLKSIKSASDQIICVKPGSKYTVSGQFDLGIVNNLWVVGSSCNKIVGSLAMGVIRTVRGL